MLSLLYRTAEALNRRTPELEYGGEDFYLDPEVYRPLHGEESIVEHLRPEDRVLDLGCGSGINTVRRRRANPQPVGDARIIQADPAGVILGQQRVEIAQLFNETAIPRRADIRHHNTVKRAFLCAKTGKTNFK